MGRVLITGVSGFAGSHLADHLLALADTSLHGTVSPRSDLHNVAHLGERICLHRLDLTDADDVQELLAEVRPDAVYHLAARASVAAAWRQPQATLDNNVHAQLNLLQAAIRLEMRPRILIVGSSDEYGSIQATELPADEDTPLRPRNPYAVSKIAQDYLGYQYYLSHKLPIFRVRPFNHIGPRQGPGFVVPDFARQIARIEASLQEATMTVGNLQAERDFADVRDVVRAYRLALTQGSPGAVYNICSGQAHSIQSLLDTLLDLSTANVNVVNDPDLMRPSDVARVVGDYSALEEATGWRPRYSFRDSLQDVLAYWRQRV